MYSVEAVREAWESSRRTKNLEVEVLHKISYAVATKKDVSLLLKEVLEILYREMDLQRGTITLKQGDILMIEASHGMTEEEIKRGIYRIGEGVTGKVAQTGKSRIVPNIAESSDFLNRTKTRDGKHNIAFICVPIIHLGEVIGTMSIDRKLDANANLGRDLCLLETVSNIIAEAVSVLFLYNEEREKLIEENNRLKSELDDKRPADLIGNCSAMRKIYRDINQFANSDIPVLINGESGTGKDLISRAIWRASREWNKSYCVAHSYALSDTLFAAELFGYEKGAFEGATSRKKGLVEKAESGTLFIDEIGQLSKENQARLKTLLQDKSYRRLGSSEERKANVRIIMSTSYDLEELVKNGMFLEDLYAQISPFKITIPPLRNRRSDIILLSEFFIEKYAAENGKKIERISTPAINMLMAYHWPGNVRELENCIERAVISATSKVILGYNLPPSLQTGQSTESAKVPSESETDFTSMVNSFERELITEALKLHKGNASLAAKHLNITQRIINYKIKKFGIKLEWFKNRSSPYFIKKRMLMKKNSNALNS